MGLAHSKQVFINSKNARHYGIPAHHANSLTLGTRVLFFSGLPFRWCTHMLTSSPSHQDSNFIRYAYAVVVSAALKAGDIPWRFCKYRVPTRVWFLICVRFCWACFNPLELFGTLARCRTPAKHFTSNLRQSLLERLDQSPHLSPSNVEP